MRLSTEDVNHHTRTRLVPVVAVAAPVAFPWAALLYNTQAYQVDGAGSEEHGHADAVRMPASNSAKHPLNACQPGNITAPSCQTGAHHTSFQLCGPCGAYMPTAVLVVLISSLKIAALNSTTPDIHMSRRNQTCRMLSLLLLLFFSVVCAALHGTLYEREPADRDRENAGSENHGQCLCAPRLQSQKFFSIFFRVHLEPQRSL